MKTLMLFAGLILYSLCLLSGTQAVPVAGDDLKSVALNNLKAADGGADGGAEHLVTLNRQKRYTCNVLNSPAACSAHCLILGKIRGGYCSNGTCYCRQ